MSEICERCGKKEEDCRTLWMACFYDMSELNIPLKRTIIFKKEGNEVYEQVMYSMRVCKDCRAAWLDAIKGWFTTDPKKLNASEGWFIPEPESGIFVRRNGTTVEIREEEWYKDNPNREPVRVKKGN